MINRYTDTEPMRPHTPKAFPPLPVIDWSKINKSAPVNIDIGNPSKDDPLPKADHVIITWTLAEWSALDHVFCNSHTNRHKASESFCNEWHYRACDKEVKGAHELWGYYRMVKIINETGKNVDVLLYKSNSHLAYPPYIDGLMKMLKLIIDEAQPKKLYSIGTAGGTSLREKLGDTVITNAANISLTKSQNMKSGLDKKESSGNWYPPLNLVSTVQDHLLFKMDQIVTMEELGYLFKKAAKDSAASVGVSVDDMINDAVNPEYLGSPKAFDRKGVPLLTTDYYYIAHSSDSLKYSALEMDDAVVGYIASKNNTDFLFIRNISDPIVPEKTNAGVKIDIELRDSWSAQIYEKFGLYTSMNGALVAWAIIAGDKYTRST